MPAQPNPDPLERATHEALRSLPQRRAPRSLEQRVLAEIARREARPWWQSPLAQWPAAVRWCFLVFSAALCATAIVVFSEFLSRSSGSSAGQSLLRVQDSIHGLVTAFRAIGSVGNDLIRLIPAPWLYAGLITFAFLYATVALVGATAYRALWRSR